MNRKSRLLLAAAGVAAAAVIPALAQAGNEESGDRETEVLITGRDLDHASRVAVDHLGSGRVTGTEIDDEESYYDVEVTLDDGRQVDVQLDENFNVVGSEDDGVGSDG